MSIHKQKFSTIYIYIYSYQSILFIQEQISRSQILISINNNNSIQVDIQSIKVYHLNSTSTIINFTPKDNDRTIQINLQFQSIVVLKLEENTRELACKNGFNSIKE